METKIEIGMKTGKTFNVENVTFENSRRKSSNFQEWINSLEFDGKGHLVFNDISVAMSEIEYIKEVK
ncbi:hypothetical protein Q8G37_15905 [Bacillus wiedmannii]|uniref:hypothetical protein n=1 Tax=Bacillus wiedmannii TaxID=1890302 RepID=UPI00272F299A|nr:hypothetical protein [Bacillus wiedmannii]MDP1457931.1 hypothetical protein [Bacillus wiedmannii]